MKRLYPEFTYSRVGGVKQLCCENYHHLEALLELDEIHWAITGISVSALDMDKDFLNLLDSDDNGRIRTDEVRNAVSWLLTMLKDRSGIDNRSEKLFLDAIDTATPDGKELYEAGKLVVNNLGTGKNWVSLQEIDNDAGILAMARQNGDGVIPPSAAETEDLKALIERIMKVIPGVLDLSGQLGINADSVAEYKKSLQKELSRRKDPGAKTGAEAEFLDAAAEAEDFIDDYFMRSAMEGFCDASPCPSAPPATPSLVEFLETAPAAPVSAAGLAPDAPFNPLRREILEKFFARRGSSAVLTFEEWKKIKPEIAAYISWKKIPAETAGNGMTTEELEAELNSAGYAALDVLFKNDIEAAKIIRQKSNLRKLLLFQRDMLQFVNNFVNLSDFFTPHAPSTLQAGTLIMDARRFTLTVNVDNVAAHKKIAVNSNICTVYLKVADSVTGFIAAGVTAGTMRRLFIGKRGIFISRTGKVSDAEIIDFIQQPVSLGEAILQPFINLGSFISKQADKIMNTNNQNIQKSIEADLSKSVQPVKPGASPAPQQSNNSLGMLLAGGGIGIAAIGSSIALLTKTIHEASPWTLPLIIFGVIFIFGGPAVIVSIIKLHKRNIGSFLEAGSAAVNHPMRMSRKLGRVFCATPKRPK